MFNTIDLFSGAGGLSHGFVQSGKFNIVAAFENNSKAQETYKKNHPDTEMYSDVCQANYTEIKNKFGNIDIVIGGPPCQGFSNANRQKNTAVNQNNKLVKQYVRAITELKPKAFVMENVSMLKSNVHRFFVENSEIELLEKYDIERTESEIVLLNKKFFKDEYVDIIQSKELLNLVIFSDDDYKFLKVLMRQKSNPEKLINTVNKHLKSVDSIIKKIEKSDSEFVNNNFENLKLLFTDIINGITYNSILSPVIEEALALMQMVKTSKEIFDNDIFVSSYNTDNGIKAIVQSYPVFDYVKKLLGSDDFGYSFTSGVLCAADFGAPQKRNRFVVIGIKKEFSDEICMPVGTYNYENYRTVFDAIGDLEDVITCSAITDDNGASTKFDYSKTDKLFNELHDSELIYNHVITNTRENALKRFEALKPGQNFHSLDNSLKVNTYSNIERTQNTIYQRLDYTSPSGTVLNVRKSMWIHPTINRAVSIREAARLQTFPDSFVFYGTKDSQYQQVGNAVPPILAKSIAEHIVKYLIK